MTDDTNNTNNTDGVVTPEEGDTEGDTEGETPAAPAEGGADNKEADAS